MKIAILGPTYPYRGGIAHYTNLLFKHLRKKHEVMFISFSRQYPALLYPGKTDKDMSTKPLTEEGVRYLLDSMNPFTWHTVAREFVKFAPEILVIPWWVTFWLPQFLYISMYVKAKSNTKILFLCHNVMPHEKSALNLWGRKALLGRGDFFIVHSNEEAEHLRRLLPGCNVKRVFHPTYGDFNVSGHEEKSPPSENSEAKILFFGFVREYKGLRYLIKAASLLKDQMMFKLVIAGEFWHDKNSYIELISECGLDEHNLEIIDRYIPNEELERFFNDSHLVVLPYTSVTGSGALQLALGFNRPVITTDVGSLKEVVIDGFNGYTVPPRDPVAIAEAIKKALVPDTFLRLVKNIKGDKERFSWDRLTETIESFIE